MSRVVVLGVGNLIMGDEGVGVRCVQALEAAQSLPPHVRLIDGGTSTHALIEEVEDLDLLLIVDAIDTGQPPGTIVYLTDGEVPAAFSNRLSPHQHGINDMLAELRLLDRAPRRVALLGVTPARVELGLDLSPAVAAVLPTLCARVLEAVSG